MNLTPEKEICQKYENTTTTARIVICVCVRARLRQENWKEENKEWMNKRKRVKQNKSKTEEETTEKKEEETTKKKRGRQERINKGWMKKRESEKERKSLCAWEGRQQCVRGDVHGCFSLSTKNFTNKLHVSAAVDFANRFPALWKYSIREKKTKWKKGATYLPLPINIDAQQCTYSNNNRSIINNYL